MTTAPATKAAAKTTPAAKVADVAPTDTAEVPAKRRGIGVGQLVAHTYDDIPTGAKVAQLGIVVEITDDGAVVAPLAEPAVVPLAQLEAL